MARDHANYRRWDNARYERRKDDIKRRVKLWVEKNRERKNANSRRWAARNLENRRFHARTRQARQRNAVPSWVNLEVVRSMYANARRLERETGIKHHVDHIVPLKSDMVCGLHWGGNLQVLRYDENIRKGNRLHA